MVAVEKDKERILRALEGTENDQGLLALVKSIDEKLHKYETRWGMFAMAASAIGAGFIAFKDWILTHVFGVSP